MSDTETTQHLQEAQNGLIAEVLRTHGDSVESVEVEITINGYRLRKVVRIRAKPTGGV